MQPWPLIPKRWGFTEFAIVVVITAMLTGPIGFLCLEAAAWVFCWYEGALP